MSEYRGCRFKSTNTFSGGAWCKKFKKDCIGEEFCEIPKQNGMRDF